MAIARAKGGLSMSISGVKDMLEAFKTSKLNIRPTFRRAARFAGSAIRKYARRLVPSKRRKVKHGGGKVFRYGNTGQLKKALDFRVTPTKRQRGSKDSTVRVIIGAKRGMKIMVFKEYYKPKKGVKAIRNAMVPYDPARISHLVENGFRQKVWGHKKFGVFSKRRFVKGRPFLAPALLANELWVTQNTARLLKEAFEKGMAKKQVSE